MTTTEMATCHGCGRFTKCQVYRRRWRLCLAGPNRCYRNRRRVVPALDQLAREKEGVKP